MKTENLLIGGLIAGGLYLGISKALKDWSPGEAVGQGVSTVLRETVKGGTTVIKETFSDIRDAVSNTEIVKSTTPQTPEGQAVSKALSPSLLFASPFTAKLVEEWMKRRNVTKLTTEQAINMVNASTSKDTTNIADKLMTLNKYVSPVSPNNMIKNFLPQGIAVKEKSNLNTVKNPNPKPIVRTTKTSDNNKQLSRSESAYLKGKLGSAKFRQLYGNR